MTAAFDTLTAAREMENAGLKREAAEAVASAIRAGQNEPATRSDLQALEARMQAMLWRAMLLQGFAIVGAVVALLKWLP